MGSQIIGQGPGNTTPESVTRMYKANGSIAKGDVVGLLVGSSGTGYTVDQTNGTTITPIGVAMAAATDGNWVEVCVGGYCNYVTNDGTDVVAGDFLVAGAGVAVPYTAAELGAAPTQYANVFGQSWDAETGTTCTEVFIFRRTP